MAWVFTAMFSTRMNKAYKTSAKTRNAAESAKPISDRHNAFSTKPTVSGNRVSYLATSQLEKGKPAMEAMGMATRILPSSASFRSKAAAMVGIREVQLEKLKPARKKKVLSARRCGRKEDM